jgi:hypothetical protein
LSFTKRVKFKKLQHELNVAKGLTEFKKNQHELNVARGLTEFKVYGTLGGVMVVVETKSFHSLFLSHKLNQANDNTLLP